MTQNSKISQITRITCLNAFPYVGTVVIERGIGFLAGRRYENVSNATFSRIASLTYSPSHRAVVSISRQSVAVFVYPKTGQLV